MACRVRLLALSAVMASICLPVAAQSIPSLVGTWKGTPNAVHVGTNPYRATGQPGVNFSANPLEVAYTITEQKDNRFAGELSGGNVKETFLGALQPDNKGGIMLDSDGQYSFTLRDPNTMDVCYSHLNPTSRVVACWMMTRSQ